MIFPYLFLLSISTWTFCHGCFSYKSFHILKFSAKLIKLANEEDLVVPWLLKRRELLLNIAVDNPAKPSTSVKLTPTSICLRKGKIRSFVHGEKVGKSYTVCTNVVVHALAKNLALADIRDFLLYLLTSDTVYYQVRHSICSSVFYHATFRRKTNRTFLHRWPKRKFRRLLSSVKSFGPNISSSGEEAILLAAPSGNLSPNCPAGNYSWKPCCEFFRVKLLFCESTIRLLHENSKIHARTKAGSKEVVSQFS